MLIIGVEKSNTAQIKRKIMKTSKYNAIMQLPDGFKFYLLENWLVVDNLNPDLVNDSYNSAIDFLCSCAEWELDIKFIK